MRRLRPTDGTKVHRRAVSYHLGACRRGRTALHAELRADMAAKYEVLITKERAGEDAEDAWTQATADLDAAEIDLENVVRDIDAELGRLDRTDPTRNAQRAVFPNGFGEVIEPEGEQQLAVLPAFRVRLKLHEAHPPIVELVAKLDAAELAFRAALAEDRRAEAQVEVLFAEEQSARQAIREQFESAYGRLRDLYKSRPTLAERFFLSEGSSRRARPATPAAAPAPSAPAPAPSAAPAPPSP